MGTWTKGDICVQRWVHDGYQVMKKPLRSWLHPLSPVSDEFVAEEFPSGRIELRSEWVIPKLMVFLKELDKQLFWTRRFSSLGATVRPVYRFVPDEISVLELKPFLSAAEQSMPFWWGAD